MKSSVKMSEMYSEYSADNSIVNFSVFVVRNKFCILGNISLFLIIIVSYNKANVHYFKLYALIIICEADRK